MLSHTFEFAPTNLVLPEAYTNTVANAIRENFASGFQGRVLDLGCGLGQNAIKIASISPRVDVVGVDISVESLRRAKLAGQTAGLSSRLSFIVSDNEHLPIKADVFQGSLVIGVLHHSHNLSKVAHELAHSLTNDSVVLVVEPSMANPMRRLGFVLWGCVPSSIRKNMPDIGENRRLPVLFPLTPRKLINVLQSSGFKVLQLRSAWLFEFILPYLATFPLFRRLFTTTLVTIAATIDRRLTNRSPLRLSGAFLIIAARKHLKRARGKTSP